jgi:hypothetical protein
MKSERGSERLESDPRLFEAFKVKDLALGTIMALCGVVEYKMARWI